MQHLYVVFINLALREETVPAERMVNSRFSLCTSLVPRPMGVVFDLGTSIHVRMRTKLENGILYNRQQLQCVGFGSVEAMKMLSIRGSVR